MRKLILLAAVMASGPAWAGGPPAGLFPAGLPNVGELWLEFCSGSTCQREQAQVWGQVCTSDTADIVINGPIDSASHMKAPAGMTFVGWRCGEQGQLITKDRDGYYDQGVFKAYPAGFGDHARAIVRGQPDPSASTSR